MIVLCWEWRTFGDLYDAAELAELRSVPRTTCTIAVEDEDPAQAQRPPALVPAET